MAHRVLGGRKGEINIHFHLQPSSLRELLNAEPENGSKGTAQPPLRAGAADVVTELAGNGPPPRDRASGNRRSRRALPFYANRCTILRVHKTWRGAGRTVSPAHSAIRGRCYRTTRNPSPMVGSSEKPPTRIEQHRLSCENRPHRRARVPPTTGVGASGRRSPLQLADAGWDQWDAEAVDLIRGSARPTHLFHPPSTGSF
jgi:hypothetical protein